MVLLQDNNQCVVHAPAKVNLHLEVLPRRSDGYHEVSTLMVPIALYDTVAVRSLPSSEIRFQCKNGSVLSDRNDSIEEIPQGADNLVVRAVELLRHRAKIAHGATVQLIKRIPAAAGLGGGSSDAAAALAAANSVWGLRWSRARLRELSAELGSDVPFFFAPDNSDGSGAVCLGRGEKLSPVSRFGQVHLAVVHPPEGLSTASVYQKCKPANPDQAVESSRRLRDLILALQTGALSRAGTLLHNRMEVAAAGLSSWVARLRHAFERTDCIGHLMSGSGTSYFGICHSARHAQAVAAKLRSRRLGKVFATHSCRLGLPVA